jgi:uncharacterized heparinase superfamily protein
MMSHHQPGSLGYFDGATRVRARVDHRIRDQLGLDEASISSITHAPDTIVFIVAALTNDLVYVITARDVGWVIGRWVVQQ